MFPVLIKLGPLTLHAYGLLVALGFLAAYTLARRRFEHMGLLGHFVDNLTLIAMVGGLFGARLLYFIVDPSTHFTSDPMAFFRIWEGGLVYYGGFVGALIALAVTARVKEIPFRVIADGLSAPLLLGQAIGRLGCFAAGCCYGRPTDSIFGVTFTRPDSLAPLGIPLHPTQLYESAGIFLLFGLLLAAERMPKIKRGDSTAFYLIGYGVVRFLIEFFRGDDRGPIAAGFSPSQLISIVLVLTGVILFLYDRRPSKI